ncbi:MAG: ABC transporter substrate-binding protein [Methanosarcinales archaeon]|jgi:ABC-type Fe3+-hydroxamate transport system substrate-binding protein|nr:ABC transporter substrate-binding protein [Methanosarcinales archaeon]
MIKKTIIMISLLFILFGTAMMPLGAADAGTTGFEPVTMTNSIGTQVTFNEPAVKVASLGLTFSTTLLALGCSENIILIDNWSESGRSGIFELESITNRPIGDGQEIAQMLANGYGGFDKDRDVIFMYGYSYHSTAIQSMETFGLKVVTFYPMTYEQGMDMTKDIGAVMGHNDKAAELVDLMQTTAAFHESELNRHGITERANAVYVSFSGGTIRVGNVNSYSVILMKIAGGVNPADDSSMIGSALTSYAVDSTFFIQMDIDVIFLDPFYSGTPDDFRAEMNINNNVKIYKLTPVMNQYGPTSIDGIQFMAKAMYPQVFGALDDQSGSAPANNMIYIAIAALLVSAIAVGYVIFRK